VRSCSGIASAAPARGPIGEGEVIPGVQRVGMVGAEDPLPVGRDVPRR
jgi:hypothetical protein